MEWSRRRKKKKIKKKEKEETKRKKKEEEDPRAGASTLKRMLVEADYKRMYARRAEGDARCISSPLFLFLLFLSYDATPIRFCPVWTST